jgi:hypothetical protein
MRWVALASLPAALAACTPHRATLADCGWLAGTWHSAQLDSHWENVAGALYGVALNDGGFEVNIISDRDDDGKHVPIALVALDNGRDAMTFALQSATQTRIVLADGRRRVDVTRTGAGWRGAFVDPPKPEVAFDMAPGRLDAAPELADADRAFAAATARDGADGWTKFFAPGGAMWRAGARVEGAAIHDAIAKTLAAGALQWTPVSSGKRGAFGFTLGAWTFSKPGAHGANGSYCTIWQRQADGTWLVVFDIGRVAA